MNGNGYRIIEGEGERVRDDFWGNVMTRMQEQFLDTSELDVSGMESWGKDLAWWQRQVNWYLGDLAKAAKAKLGEDNYSQVFPVDV